MKIGFVDTISGPFANVGKLAEQGAKIVVDEWNKNGGVLGRPIQLVVKDEAASTTKSVQAMRELASNHVNLITGFTLSSDVLAAKSIIEKNNMAVVTANVTDTSLTTTQRTPNIYEVAANMHMLNVAAAHLAATKWKDVTTWDGVAYDYLTGHDAWKEFGQSLSAQKAPGKPGKSVFVPLTSTQDTSYINSLAASKPDPKSSGLYYFLFGGGGVQFAKQAEPVKLLSQYKTIAAVGTGDMVIASALGAALPDINMVYDYHWQGYDNPTNNAFVNDWKKLPAVGGLKLKGPNTWAYEGYTAVLAILNAVKAAGTDDSSAVLKSLASVSFDSPMGKVHFNSSHLLAAPVTVWECKGDASAQYGYSCSNSQAIPPSITQAQ